MKNGVLRRSIAVAAVGATALGAPFAGGVAGAQMAPALPPIVDVGPFCANVPTGFAPFTDAGTTFAREISCLFAAGVTSGTSATTYSPTWDVRRDQMAALVARMMDAANALDADDNIAALPAPAATPQFTDTAGNRHGAAIERLAAAGIVSGGPGALPDTQYGTSYRVARDQMATILTNAIAYLTGERPTTTDDYFADDTGNIHQTNINVIASLGVARGTGAGTYSPSRRISRGQVAGLVLRATARLEQDGLVTPLPFIDAAASGATVVDNANGTATATIVVRNGAGNPVTGLGAGDITYVFGGTRYALNDPRLPFWSGFTEATPGNYTAVFTPPGPGTYPATDVMVRGVIIAPTLTVVVTNAG
jgi:hypothetical protein